MAKAHADRIKALEERNEEFFALLQTQAGQMFDGFMDLNERLESAVVTRLATRITFLEGAVTAATDVAIAHSNLIEEQRKIIAMHNTCLAALNKRLDEQQKEIARLQDEIHPS